MTLKRYTSPDLQHTVLYFARRWPYAQTSQAQRAWEQGMGKARNTNIWRIIRPHTSPHRDCVVIGMGEVSNGSTMRRMLDAVLDVPGSEDDELDEDFLNALLKRRLRTIAQRQANKDYGSMVIRGDEEHGRRLDQNGRMSDA